MGSSPTGYTELLTCSFPSSSLRVGDHFMHQHSPLLSVSHQPWTLHHCSVWPVLDIVCPSLSQFAPFSPTDLSFQYFGTQIFILSVGFNLQRYGFCMHYLFGEVFYAASLLPRLTHFLNILNVWIPYDCLTTITEPVSNSNSGLF